MKIIVTSSGTFGPFSTIENLEDRYLCNSDVELPFDVIGESTVQDAGDYVAPLSDEDLNKLKAEKNTSVYAECDRLIWKMVENYSESERMTFSRQNAEAYTYTKDNTVATPMIDAIVATNSNVTKADLVARILEKAEQFSEYSGRVVGWRQALSYSILNASASTINDINPLAGWPSS